MSVVSRVLEGGGKAGAGGARLSCSQWCGGPASAARERRESKRE